MRLQRKLVAKPPDHLRPIPTDAERGVDLRSGEHALLVERNHTYDVVIGRDPARESPEPAWLDVVATGDSGTGANRMRTPLIGAPFAVREKADGAIAVPAMNDLDESRRVVVIRVA